MTKKELKPKVSIIGGGRIGQSIRRVLIEEKKITPYLWDRQELHMHERTPLDQTVLSAEYLFLCIPSWSLRDVFQEIQPFLSSRTIVIAFAKGLEKGTYKVSSEIAQEEIPKNPFCVFGGPFMAEEVDKGFFGIGIIGTKNRSNFLKLNKLFAGTSVKLSHSPHPRSVALAGVIKNIYAVGMGIADGLNWGTNAKGWLAAQSVTEMKEMAKNLHVHEKVMEHAGVSDFLASGFSPYSRNRKTGEEILKWNAASIESESIISFPSLNAILPGRGVKLPIFNALSEILLKNGDPYKIFNKLLSSITL